MSEIFPNVRKLSKTAEHILKTRYFNKDIGETVWEQLVDRVIENIMPSSPNKEDTRQLILNTYFVPNSPCLVNAGKKNSGLSACYVVGMEDNLESIIKAKGDFMQVAKKGGGCGTSLSKLRPENAPVNGSTHGFAGGGIKFADTISHDADAMTQAGFRSMAIMFTMSVYHPDILKFINAKHGDSEEAEEKRIVNANMSVVVDNKFMEAVKNGEKFWTEFNGKKYQEYDAKTIYDLIIDGAWRNGEPGILFQDAIDKSPYKEVGQEISATNPCAEQPLPPNGVCNLGSLDISKFLTKEKEIDWEKLDYAITLAVRFLNNVIDVTTYPTEDIKQWSFSNRPIGLGIMGFADYLLIKKITYGSQESIDELENILGFIYSHALYESTRLGEQYGIPSECDKLSIPRRNITVLTIAPTGTISLLAGCSSGIEPIFSEITIRNDKTGSYTFENNLADKDYFRCAVASNGATEVTWEEHIQILAAAQRNVDSGVSKTINFPKMTHRETMAKAGMLAWELGCKGVAMYRNESRKVQVLTPKALKKDRCPVCGNELVEIDNKKKCVGCKSEVEQNTSPAYDL